MNEHVNMNFVTFDKEKLIPAAWRDRFDAGYLLFNPTLTQVDDGYAMCYRVASPTDQFRLLATCHLTKDLNLVPGSVTPLSDFVEFSCKEGLNDRALTWHADARYHRLGDNLYLTWNDGGNRPINHQFIVEMKEDGLKPASEARELTLHGIDRRNTEKNWMLIRGNDGMDYVIYSCSPHIILQIDWSHEKEVPCTLIYETGWENRYSTIFGVIRGGAQPIPIGTDMDGKAERFLSIVHSSYKLTNGRKYEMAAYEFEPNPPFAVTRCVSMPIPLCMGEMRDFEFPKLNQEVLSVVYPCGAILDGDELILSYGINDENLAITKMPLKSVDNAMVPVETEPSRMVSFRKPSLNEESVFGSEEELGVPLFWWDAAGKKFDGDRGTRRFQIGNFGDIASREVIERITGKKTVKPVAGSRKMISIGSVLHTASDGDLIWGSGVKGTMRKMKADVESLDIRAVRGPLTLDFLRESNYDVSKVTEVFDPGCLIDALYADEIRAYDVSSNKNLGSFRIVPHYRDDLLFRRMYYDLHHTFLTVDCTPQQMIEGMLGAEAVYSSSLHGVIFAESLGIPAYWLNSIGGEDGYKFYDYYYGTGRYAVKRFDSLEDAMKSKPMPLPQFRSKDYLATFPYDQQSSLASSAHGLRIGSKVKLGNRLDNNTRTTISSLPGQTRNSPDGVWFVGTQSTVGIRVALDPGQSAMLNLELRPFNHVKLREPRRIKVVIGDTVCHEIAWKAGDTSTRSVTTRIDWTMLNGAFLRLDVECDNAVPPKKIGVAEIPEPITCKLQDISLNALS